MRGGKGAAQVVAQASQDMSEANELKAISMDSQPADAAKDFFSRILDMFRQLR